MQEGPTLIGGEGGSMVDPRFDMGFWWLIDLLVDWTPLFCNFGPNFFLVSNGESDQNYSQQIKIDSKNNKNGIV